MHYPFCLYSDRIDHRPVFNGLAGDPFIADLSPDSLLLNGVDMRDQKKFQEILEQKMGTTFTWGLAGATDSKTLDAQAGYQLTLVLTSFLLLHWRQQRMLVTLLALGVVSFFTDLSSEMIYPLLPAFLTGPLHAGPALLGVIEGLAETVAALVKVVSGRVSDRLPRRKPLVVAGSTAPDEHRLLNEEAPAGVQLLYGKGAGMMPTAAAVVSDIIEVSRNILQGLYQFLIIQHFKRGKS